MPDSLPDGAVSTGAEMSHGADRPLICESICDFCVHYDFNADADGAYTGEGRCNHPAHPHPADPLDWCSDFVCRLHAEDFHGYSVAELEAAAFELYAAGPWGEFITFLDKGARAITDAHSMPTYRRIVRDVVKSLAGVREGPPSQKKEDNPSPRGPHV